MTSEPERDISALAERFERWMYERSLPFWADHAPDPEGGFYERLDLDSQPILGEDSRVRVQARMGYCFALGAENGWEPERARQLANRSLDTLLSDCRRGDGLYGKMVDTGRGLTDETPELYDNAFALLAFATIGRVFGDARAMTAAGELHEAIERLLRRDAGEGSEAGGYRERLPAPERREQNPHMHLTEASLAWYEASGDRTALKRAERIAHFVADRFFDADAGLLFEFAGVGTEANHVEAGHHFEWVWLLDRLAQNGGAVLEGLASKLHDGGIRLLEGLDYLPLSQELDGSVRQPKQRTWTLTEKLKGHIALYRMQSRDDLLPLILATGNSLWNDHIAPGLPGAWTDAIDPDGRSLVEDITPATGYHLYLALDELSSFAKSLDQWSKVPR